MVRTILLLISGLLLTACTTGGLGVSGDGRHAPAFDLRKEAVDGLIVGDRLMAAEEYELAYDSYIRAAATHGMTADVLTGLGSASLQLGRINQAEELLRRAVTKDDTSAPAWNNLGVALMSQGNFAEARQVFRRAFVLSGGSNDEIRENLRLAIANLDNPAYDAVNQNEYKLVHRGQGDFLRTNSE